MFKQFGKYNRDLVIYEYEYREFGRKYVINHSDILFKENITGLN